jgi:Uncharacterized conserved protein
MSLPPELEKARQEIEAIARDYGLDFFPVVFELVTYRQMNQLAAYTGFPIRYPHWRWGMEYERVRKSYAYGLQIIHEMVINNDPCYAYLLASNTMLEHKMVMAHVYAHADFLRTIAGLPTLTERCWTRWQTTLSASNATLNATVRSELKVSLTSACPLRT